MIFLATNRHELVSAVLDKLESIRIPVRYSKPNSNTVQELYQKDITALVVDDHHANFPTAAWMDILEGIGRRIPVVVLSNSRPASGDAKNHYLFWVSHPTPQSIIDCLETTGVLGRLIVNLQTKSIRLYDESFPLKMLTKNSSLSMLYIDASELLGLSVDQGNIVFQRAQAVFEEKLTELWGKPGSFRNGDVLFKKSPGSCVYFIFLEVSRASNSVPVPGALEKLSDRVTRKLQKSLWDDFFLKKDKRLLPESITMIPRFSIGFSTILFNPCIKAEETIETIIEKASVSAKINAHRIGDREREIIQSLIQYEGLLTPNFQAVFWTKTLSRSDLEKSIKEGKISYIKNYLYGFESLIRISGQQVASMLEEEGPVYLEPAHLRPDVLFYLAGKYQLSLELDQACIKLGSRLGAALPGKLLINILPRNLYYVENIEHMIPENVEVIFELSESEAINNFELLLSVRQNLSNMNLGIAADDFGKGYAGLERVIKVKPDLIKLDRMLIQNIDQDPGKMAFVKGLVQAARTSKSMILAEGVERIEEFEALSSIGVDLMQGYLFHRPQKLEVILSDLATEVEGAQLIRFPKLA